MLRYFYILICIHVSFSYDFTESNPPKVFKVRDNRKYNEEGKVVLLDMESFMSDDDPQDYEPFDFNSNLNRGTQNEDYYLSPINKIKREQENADYSNLKDNDDIVGNLIDDRTLNMPTRNEAEKQNKISALKGKEAENKPIQKHAVQDPAKKCRFRNMKIPFFSHKTTKQHKRRKLECVNCEHHYTIDPESQENEKVNQIARRLKRAYGNVCPNCIRTLLKRFHKKQLAIPKKPDQIHKNKEFPQKMATTVSRGNELRRKGNDNFEYYNIDERIKRDEVKERQMKELAEVEMKVDQVKVTTPTASGRVLAVTTRTLRYIIINDV